MCEPQAAGILLGVVPGPGTSTAFVRSAHGTALGEERGGGFTSFVNNSVG
jgi:hypothetical protein